MYKSKYKYIFPFVLLFLFPLKGFTALSDQQELLLESLPPDQRESVLKKMDLMEKAQSELDDIFEDPNTLIRRPELDEKPHHHMSI